MAALWLYKESHIASNAGRGTYGLDDVGFWVGGESMVETTGLSGGPAGGSSLGGRDSMAGVTMCRLMGTHNV